MLDNQKYPGPLPGPGVRPQDVILEQGLGALPPFDPAQVVGKTEDDARLYLEGQGLSMRVTMEDGVPFIVTCDWKPQRVNVATVGGLVTQISGLG